VWHNWKKWRKFDIKIEGKGRIRAKYFLKTCRKKYLSERGGLIHTGSIQQDLLFFFRFFYEAERLYLIKRRTKLLLKGLTINLPEKAAGAVNFCFYA
jgi:hypothetical protein